MATKLKKLFLFFNGFKSVQLFTNMVIFIQYSAFVAGSKCSAMDKVLATEDFAAFLVR